MENSSEIYHVSGLDPLTDRYNKIIILRVMNYMGVKYHKDVLEAC